MNSPGTAGGALRAPYPVTYRYRRSVGGAVERFLRGLARGELVGSAMPDGRVFVPPVDADPASGAPPIDFVRVADTGSVRTWTWVARPVPSHPLDRPFAFALIVLDGADTALLHVVDVGSSDDMVTGLRVRADWSAQRTGGIRDIRAFVPATTGGAWGPAPTGARHGGHEAPLTVGTDIGIDYTFEPGLVLSRFYRQLAAGRIEGGRCDSCAATYVPPRPRCPVCGGGPLTEVAASDHGTIESFAIVHLPVAGFDADVPFAWAWIRLDGVDVPFPHLVGGCDLSAVHVGQRVQAVWAPAGGRPVGWEAIVHFIAEHA